MILFLKSKSAEIDDQTPLPEKLLVILKMRIDEAKTDQDRARAQRDLDKFKSDTSS
jgi:hypothetical protein